MWVPTTWCLVQIVFQWYALGHLQNDCSFLCVAEFPPQKHSLYKMCTYAASHIHLRGARNVLKNEDIECISAVVQAQPLLLILNIHLPASLLTTSLLSKNLCSPVMRIISTEHFTYRKGERLIGHSWCLSLLSCIVQQNQFILSSFRNFYRIWTLSKQYMFGCFSFLVSYIHVWINWQACNFEGIYFFKPGNNEVILDIYVLLEKCEKFWLSLFSSH